MMTWLEVVAHYKGYQNLLSETGGVRFAPAVRKPRESLHRQALRELGRYLVRWGQELQERHLAPVPPSSGQAHRTG